MLLRLLHLLLLHHRLVVVIRRVRTVIGLEAKSIIDS
jgi:hypothetical protein